MIDKKIDENEWEELKMVFNHCLDKRKDIMKSNEISYHEKICDILGKDSNTSDQIFKIHYFSAKMM